MFPVSRRKTANTTSDSSESTPSKPKIHESRDYSGVSVFKEDWKLKHPDGGTSELWEDYHKLDELKKCLYENIAERRNKGEYVPSLLSKDCVSSIDSVAK